MKVLSIMGLLLLCSACAYSPQQIQISPSIGVDGERYGNGRAVAVMAEDHRPSQVIGTRGGAYAETSTISIKNSLTDAVVQAATAKLAAQGFAVNGSDTDTQMTIIIDELAYDVVDNGVLKKLVLAAKLQVALARDNKTFVSAYKTDAEYEALKSPSPERNEKLINDLVSETLGRIFVDPKVKDFLSGV